METNNQPNQPVSLANIAAFCILMQQHGGLISKSPTYVLEKFNRYCEGAGPNAFLWGLDNDNRMALLKWMRTWGLKKEVAEFEKYLEDERQAIVEHLIQEN